jgi:hypothetical protein
MSQQSTFAKPHACGLDANQLATFWCQPNAAWAPSGPGLSADVSAALLVLQLKHTNVAAVDNANWLLAAHFLANALNDERNACFLRHCLEATLVSHILAFSCPPRLTSYCWSQAAYPKDTSTLCPATHTSSTSQCCCCCTTLTAGQGQCAEQFSDCLTHSCLC